MDGKTPREAGHAVKIAVKSLNAGKVDIEEVRNALEEIFVGGVPDVLLGAFLALLSLDNPKVQDSAVIAACASVMRSHAAAADLDASGGIDIVGTGGDGKNTFNVSTASALLVAGAGVKVVKHGNRAASSSTGSADILEALGGKLELNGPQCKQVLDASGFCFLFARVFHPGMRHVGPARAALGIRTIFNVLGPLTNPGRPPHMLTGVFAEYLGPLYAAALKELGVRRAWVVFGCEGLDELSIAGPSKVWSLKDDTVEEFTVTPDDAGLSRHPLESCGSGKPDENAGVLRKLIAGELQGPVVDFVLLNAGAALHVAGKADSLRGGVEVARTAMMEGKGASVLEKYASASKQAA